MPASLDEHDQQVESPRPERHRLPALKDAGFAGYLVKPIRAASLKAQLVAAPHFDGVAATEAATPSAAEIFAARSRSAAKSVVSSVHGCPSFCPGTQSSSQQTRA